MGEDIVPFFNKLKNPKQELLKIQNLYLPQSTYYKNVNNPVMKCANFSKLWWTFSCFYLFYYQYITTAWNWINVEYWLKVIHIIIICIIMFIIIIFITIIEIISKLWLCSSKFYDNKINFIGHLINLIIVKTFWICFFC